MLNSAIIIGRLVKDPEMYGNDKRVAKMNIAVDDGYGDKKRTDYIPVTAFGKTAEFCDKYLAKGVLVSVKGKVRTGSYEKRDGTRAYTFEIAVDDINRLEWKGYDKKGNDEPVPDGFERVTEDVPF